MNTNTDFRQEQLSRTVEELIEARNFIKSTDKPSKERYLTEINNAIFMLRAGDKTLSGMYRAKQIINIVNSLKK